MMILRPAMPLDSSGCGACGAENGDGTTEETLLDGLADGRHCLLSFFFSKLKMMLPPTKYNGLKVSPAMQPMQVALTKPCIGKWSA
jgi:hypothetical protein